MKIKWIGPKHYPDFGACLPGQIVTEEQVSLDVMTKWVSQGFAEWCKDFDPINHTFTIPAYTGPEKTVRKKKKINREV